MHISGMIRITESTTIGEAARLMQRRGVGVLLVTDGQDEPVGVLTERHLVEAVAASRHPDHGTAASHMARVIVDSDGAARLPDVDTTALIGIGARLPAA